MNRANLLVSAALGLVSSLALPSFRVRTAAAQEAVAPIVAGFEIEDTRQGKGRLSDRERTDLTAFLLSSESDGITGKFISAPWDPWDAPEFRAMLRSDKDFCTIRRIDNKTFFKKS